MTVVALSTLANGKRTRYEGLAPSIRLTWLSARYQVLQGREELETTPVVHLLNLAALSALTATLTTVYTSATCTPGLDASRIAKKCPTKPVVPAINR